MGVHIDDNFTGAAQFADRSLQYSPLVEDQLRLMRARAEARRILDEEQQGPLPPFDAGTLSEILARPQEPAMRADGLIPWQAATLLIAQRKTGKTTLVLNLARSLLTGQDFLGRFPVRPLDGIVSFLNFEVSAQQLARWARDVGVPEDRIYLVNLRGRRNPFGSAEDRGALAETLRARGVEALIVDPFGRAYTGASQNDPGEVGGWLADLDRWARSDVGVPDVVLTAHAGWNGERTRGSSALEDWADVIVTLTRDVADDAGGERYLRAIGRDVDVDEDRLDFDSDTRHLTLAGAGSRTAVRQTKAGDALRAAVLRIVKDRPGSNGAKVEETLRERGISFQRGKERKALAELVESGELVIDPGPRGAKCYSPSPTLPDPPQGEPGDPPHPPYIGGGSRGVGGRTDPPRSTCTVCGQPMMVVEDGQTAHPTCQAAEATDSDGLALSYHWSKRHQRRPA